MPSGSGTSSPPQRAQRTVELSVSDQSRATRTHSVRAARRSLRCRPARHRTFVRRSESAHMRRAAACAHGQRHRAADGAVSGRAPAPISPSVIRLRRDLCPRHLREIRKAVLICQFGRSAEWRAIVEAGGDRREDRGGAIARSDRAPENRDRAGAASDQSAAAAGVRSTGFGPARSASPARRERHMNSLQVENVESPTL